MHGLMQDWPLTVDRFITHAAAIHGQRKIISRHTDGSISRTTYQQMQSRAMKFSAALQSLGIKSGDRVATLAWNSARHMECWYGTMGIGAVLHTLNPRLHPDQLVWIAKDAGSRILILDTSFIALIEPIRHLLPFEHYLILARQDEMPANTLDALSYEHLINEAGDTPQWGGFDEHGACGLCYTSGTTGNPKGVLYSHRSNTLHAMTVANNAALGIGPDDIVMPVVPMFHANAWGLVFACPMVGAGMVMPGGQLDGASVYELLDSERVTFSAAVPTVWLGLLDYLRANNLKLPWLKRVVIGGAALPEAILRAFEDEFGVEVRPGWGMTETSPIGAMGGIPALLDEADSGRITAYKLKQGRPPFGVEFTLVDENDSDLPWDGATSGRLKVRGFAVTNGYFNGAGGHILDKNGFFDTGDVATIDTHGTMQITDRAKDVIKSGGEWISSIEIENIALSHPAVANAAAIGVPHPKWDERPVLIVEPRTGAQVCADDLREFLNGKIAKWWMPDEFVFMDTIPLGATGKVNKLALREMMAAR
ncbi:MAG: long-chain-fatty-acid--CoA ligase [Sphingomonadaceae bacterium]